MSRICRTCLSKITSEQHIDLKQFLFAKKQLMLCIPELNFDVVLDPVICMTCARALHAAYKYKSCCLRTEERIRSYIQMLTISQDNRESVPVLFKNNNMIDLTEMLSVNEDVKEEYTPDATDENCDIVETNYEGIKEVDIKIEEIELDKLIKNEAFDSCSDAGMSFSLEQRLQFENETSQMQDILSEDHIVDKSRNCEPILARLDISENISNNNGQMLHKEYCEATSSMEIKHEIDFLDLGTGTEDNGLSSSGIEMKLERQPHITVKQSEDLLEQYSKSDYGIYIVNIGNSNSPMICAESCTKQDNGVTKTPEIDRLESKNSLPTGTFSSLEMYMNIESNNTTVTEAEAKLSNVALWNSNSFNDDSSQHSDSFSAHVKNHELGIISQFVDTVSEKPFKRNFCDFASSQQGELKRYIRHHIGEKTYKCNFCDYASLRQDSLKLHVAKHIAEKPFKCYTCDYRCSQNGTLKIHMRSHTGQKPYKCNSCDYASSQKSNLKIHMRSHTGEKPYKCNSCDYASSRQGSLKLHMAKHTAEKPFKCDCCDYTCTQKCTLKIHMRSHTGEKPYKCIYCDYASSRNTHLKMHMGHHTGEKPYKCNSCHYASTNACTLEIHMRRHTGEKTYKCDACNYTSTRKDHLKIHMRHHTGEKPYKCNSCDYASSQKVSLKIHMTKHTM